MQAVLPTLGLFEDCGLNIVSGSLDPGGRQGAGS
jgi:hypothetical protein